ncbi:MAG: MBL fold metallo-hydrolase [Flavobacteriaceae bacterium]|nr:MBL fold metallo-hydrolase [Flavobacteriaceae bacterium]
MKVEQLYTSCLSEMAYYIESEGEVAIIDPLRESAPYLKMAKENKSKIKYIFLTHFHADFVSGQVDLAKKTGATIVFGPNALPEYDIHKGIDGEKFVIGNVNLTLLHTPGHTMESSTYLLEDENKKPYCIFTGDTLFIGDVGRPDLAVKSDLTREDLAGNLFDSLRNKIMPLSDYLIVYPNHGAGSSCGKNMSKETFDTLGNQKKTNYALRVDMTKQEFIDSVLCGLTEPPAYFPNNVKMNKQENTPIDDIMKKGTSALSLEEFKVISSKEDVLVLDTRSNKDYTEQGTVKGAVFIGIQGGFAPWVGALIKDINQKIVLISEPGREEETVTRLSRVGYDNTLGYLKGGIEAWKQAGLPIDKVNSMTAEEFSAKMNNKELEIPLDVRKPSEYSTKHVDNVDNFSLDAIFENIEKLDKNKDYYIHCQGGYRSLIAASIFKANGFENITDIAGGFKAIEQTDVKLV